MEEKNELGGLIEEGADAIILGVIILVAIVIGVQFGWTEPMEDAVASLRILPTSGVTLGVLSIAIFFREIGSEGTRGMA